MLRSPALRKAALCLVLCTAAVQGARAADTLPQTLPREVAAELGDLYVYYNDRICPLQTLAKDFTVKLCGKSRYRGLTPEQVLSGWLFYYDDWKREPMIRIRSAGALCAAVGCPQPGQRIPARRGCRASGGRGR